MPIPRCSLKTYVVSRREMVKNKSKEANKNKNSADNNVYSVEPGREKKS